MEDVTMKKPAKIILSVLPVFFFSVHNGFAADFLSSDEISQVLLKNSVESKHVIKDVDVKYYFESKGTYQKQKNDGSMGGGSWVVEKDGIFCMHGKKRRCWKLKSTDEENVYHVYGKTSGEHTKTWKILPGNAFNF
jgi:hypothetical protein